MSKTDELIKKIIDGLDKPNYIRPQEIPDIDLYMDQVTTFMNEHLDGCRRYPDDKILTKTMINNYAKNQLLPSPEKKKYSKDHILILIFIYYLKGFLSISDIQTLLQPLVTEHYNTQSNTSLEEIYSVIFSLEKERLQSWKTELSELSDTSKTVFREEKDSELLQSFALICLLSFDVYIRKRTIEQMLDELVKPVTDRLNEKPEKKEKKEKKEKIQKPQ